MNEHEANVWARAMREKDQDAGIVPFGFPNANNAIAYYAVAIRTTAGTTYLYTTVDCLAHVAQG